MRPHLLHPVYQQQSSFVPLTKMLEHAVNNMLHLVPRLPGISLCSHVKLAYRSAHCSEASKEKPGLALGSGVGKCRYCARLNCWKEDGR